MDTCIGKGRSSCMDAPIKIKTVLPMDCLTLVRRSWSQRFDASLDIRCMNIVVQSDGGRGAESGGGRFLNMSCTVFMAEAIAIEEATGRADQQDSAVEDGEKGLQEQEQERGGFMDVLRATTTDEFDGPQVPHLTVSAPVPREPGSTPDGRAPILASPPWAQVQGQEQEQEEQGRAGRVRAM